VPFAHERDPIVMDCDDPSEAPNLHGRTVLRGKVTPSVTTSA
jgi:hypothetical protein